MISRISACGAGEAPTLMTLGLEVTEGTTVQNIIANPKNLTIVEIVAENLVNTLQDVNYAVINGNYALEAGITSSVFASSSLPALTARMLA